MSDDYFNDIAEKALKGADNTAKIFQRARESGLYKIRKNWQITDKELDVVLNKGAANSAGAMGRLIIAEYVMQEYNKDPKAFKKLHERKTVWDVYTEGCDFLQALLRAGYDAG